MTRKINGACPHGKSENNKKEIIIIMIIGKGQSHKAVKVIVVLSM